MMHIWPILRQRQTKRKSCGEQTAGELHRVRARAAEEFAGEIEKQMSELNFLDARFEIRLSDAGRFSASGKDDAEFYFSANRESL